MMPMGPPELHKKWKDDGNATQYLEDRGYYLSRNWCWYKPQHRYIVTQEEFEAICYLIWEWDYDQLVDPD